MTSEDQDNRAGRSRESETLLRRIFLSNLIFVYSNGFFPRCGPYFHIVVYVL
ncbi:hypothetical protein GJAV_G00107080 [Gymnothorax javanicus]|nr:hypothetical protein GJAV_G00107080 [Gymnothorax javanicus]